MRDTKSIGDIGEAAILTDLLKKGYKILVPFGESLPFDLVAYKDKKFLRVQVKTTKSNGNSIVVRLRTISNGKVSKVYTDEHADYIGVYDITTSTCVYISSEVFTKYKNEIKIGLKEGHINFIKNFGMVG